MTADTVGGVWNYCLDLARSRPWRDVTICLATMGAPLSRSQAEEAATLANVEIETSAWKLEWMDDPWSDVEAAGDWLLELEARFAPDIVHLNGYAHGALPFAAPKVVVGHSCVLSWWHAVKGHPAPPRWSRYQEAVRSGLEAADAIVAPSRAMLEELTRWYGPLKKGSVIHNGCAPENFEPCAKEPFILAAGRAWDEAKNIAALAEVAAALEWPLYLAGDSKGPEPHHETQTWKGLQHLGKLSRSELAGWCGRASIYALPARYEPFGLSILEAALAGCALVLGDIPSLRELWDDAAMFVSPDDREQLKERLDGLIKNPVKRAALASRAKARAQQFTIDRTAEAYLDVCRSLLSKSAAARKELVPCA